MTIAIKRITKSRDVKALNKLKLPTKSFEVSCIEAWVVWQNEGYQQVDNYLFSKTLGENSCNFKTVKLCF